MAEKKTDERDAAIAYFASGIRDLFRYAVPTEVMDAAFAWTQKRRDTEFLRDPKYAKAVTAYLRRLTSHDSVEQLHADARNTHPAVLSIVTWRIAQLPQMFRDCGPPKRNQSFADFAEVWLIGPWDRSIHARAEQQQKEPPETGDTTG